MEKKHSWPKFGNLDSWYQRTLHCQMKMSQGKSSVRGITCSNY